jgi:AraC-like DNA-binding protein
MARTAMRGVLRPAVSGQHYRLTRFPAPDGLEHLVEHLWVAEWELRRPYTAEVLPHPNVNLCVMAGATRISGTGRKVFTQRLDGVGRVVGVTYRPGAFRLLLDVPAHSLNDRLLPLSAVYDVAADDLEAAALGGDVPAALRRVETLLRTRVPAADPRAELATRVVGTAVADTSIGTVETLAARFGVTVRQLQRLFAAYVGPTPKWVLMRARLHDATDVLADGVADGRRPDWSRFAADLGYYDQSHLIRAFRAALGITPEEYLRRCHEPSSG